jgi:hypothetical protein
MLITTRQRVPSRMNRIEILPWRIFLEKLWNGEILKS